MTGDLAPTKETLSRDLEAAEGAHGCSISGPRDKTPKF